MFQPLPVSYAENKIILNTDTPPFDGNPVLVKSRSGVVEAWWQDSVVSETPAGREVEGFNWVCYDDAFQLELDDVVGWMPIPS